MADKILFCPTVDSMVVKMGRGLSIFTSTFLMPHSKKQVLQALVLSNLDYCPVVWSSAARKDLVKLSLAQIRRLVLIYIVIRGLIYYACQSDKQIKQLLSSI